MGMVVKSPVVVMALYDIGRDGWGSYRMSYDTYLWWMRNTLSLDANIVVYTEEKFAERIGSYRREFDPELEKTKIVTASLEHLPCHLKYRSKLEHLMFSEDFKRKVHHDVPEMNRPLYNVIMFNKPRFLEAAKDAGFFGGDLFIWADAGGLREDVKNYAGKVWPSLEKINALDNSRITFFSHNDNFSVSDREYHSLSQIRNIQGTSFVVPGGLVGSLVRDFEETVDECLDSGYIGSDEKVLDIMYCKDADRYGLIKCTWREYFEILS